MSSTTGSETPTPLSQRTRIVVWFCEQCGYWRPDETTGLHMAPDDPRGKLISHELRAVEFAAVGGGGMSTLRDQIGREPCCDQDFGGSHYHCARCNGVSSMMGHYTDSLWIRGKPLKLPEKPDGSPWFTCDPEYQELKQAATNDGEATQSAEGAGS